MVTTHSCTRFAPDSVHFNFGKLPSLFLSKTHSLLMRCSVSEITTTYTDTVEMYPAKSHLILLTRQDGLSLFRFMFALFSPPCKHFPGSMQSEYYSCWRVGEFNLCRWRIRAYTDHLRLTVLRDPLYCRFFIASAQKSEVLKIK